MTFKGTMLTHLREGHQPRISQEKLAAQVGCSSDTIYRAESGRNVPEAETLARIAQFFDVAIERFFTDVDGEETAA